MKQNYLVTGGAGFIGSHLVERLLSDGHRVTVVDNLSTGRFSNIESVAESEKLRIIVGSVSDRELVEPLVRDCDAIFHLASPVGVRLIMERPVETIQGIFTGTDTVFDFAARYRRKVLLTSTSEVYGKSADVPFREEGDRLQGPTSLHRWAYASAKALDEFLALAHFRTTALPVVIVRLFNTVGPRQSGHYGMVIPNFVGAALEGKALSVYGDGEQSRCFLHVADAVEALVSVMNERKCEGKVINIGSDEEVTILKLARRIQALTDTDAEIEIVPYDEVYPEGGFEDMRRRVPALDRIERLTGWRPRTSLDTILSDVIAHHGASEAGSIPE